MKYCGDWTENPTPWIDNVYDVWMCDAESVITQILGNMDFKGLMYLVPYREYKLATDSRRWQDFMSSNWAWEEVVSELS